VYNRKRGHSRPSATLLSGQKREAGVFLQGDRHEEGKEEILERKQIQLGDFQIERARKKWR